MTTDPKKIMAMVEWPTPKTIKELKGFLGLTGYYRKFVKGYGMISKPLTELLKKNGSEWSDRAKTAFNALKEAIAQAPILALPDFTKSLILETDAYDTGVGVVLVQKGRAIAFLGQALAPKQLGLSIYDKELIAVLMAVNKENSILYSSNRLLKKKTMNVIQPQ